MSEHENKFSPEESSSEYSFRDDGNLAEINIEDEDHMWEVCKSICASLGNPINDSKRDYFFKKEMGGELRPGGVFAVSFQGIGKMWASVRNGRGDEEYIAMLRKAVEDACNG